MAIRYPQGSVTWTLHLVGGSSWELPVKTWSISRNRRDPLSWDVTLPLTPELRRATGAIGQHLKPHSYNGSWELQRWLQCVIQVGEESWTSPKLVIKTRRSRIVAKERVLSLSGGDRFESLLEKDVVEDDVRSTEASLASCHAIVGQSLEARGIYDYSLLFPDFYIRTFHRTGTPLAFLRELWDVYQCDSYWSEDTLVIAPGGRNPGAETADFTLTEDADCIVIDHQECLEDCLNEATVERPEELKRATSEPVVGKALGPVPVALDTPQTSAIARIQLFSPGYHADWVWDDEEGTPLTPSPTKIYRGSTPAATLRFNIYPPVGSSSLDEIPYSVEIVGSESLESLGGYEEDVHWTHTDPASVALIGPRRPDAPKVMQHIPNQAVCQDAAEALVAEEALNYETAQVEAPLKLVHPSQVGEMNSAALELADHNMLAQTVAFRGDSRSMMMAVGLGRGPT